MLAQFLEGVVCPDPLQAVIACIRFIDSFFFVTSHRGCLAFF